MARALEERSGRGCRPWVGRVVGQRGPLRRAVVEVSGTFYPDDDRPARTSAVVPDASTGSSASIRAAGDVRRGSGTDGRHQSGRGYPDETTTRPALRRWPRQLKGELQLAMSRPARRGYASDRAGPGEVEPPAADGVRQDLAVPCRRLRDVDARTGHVEPGLPAVGDPVGAGARRLRRLGWGSQADYDDIAERMAGALPRAISSSRSGRTSGDRLVPVGSYSGGRSVRGRLVGVVERARRGSALRDVVLATCRALAPASMIRRGHGTRRQATWRTISQ